MIDVNMLQTFLRKGHLPWHGGDHENDEHADFLYTVLGDRLVLDAKAAAEFFNSIPELVPVIQAVMRWRQSRLHGSVSDESTALSELLTASAVLR